MRLRNTARLINPLFTRPLVSALLMTGAMRAQAPAGGEPPTAGGPQTGSGQAQGSGQGQGHRGQFAGMGRVAGEVTSVAGATVTVKAEDGSAVQIVTTDNTRVMKDRGPVKISDLHPGDGLMAFGNLDPATHTLHAAMVMAEDAAEVKAMRENLGKTYISGRVTAVDLDNAKMTVERPDHVAQTIGFDETTSFKRAVRGERSGAGGAGTGSGGTGSGGNAGGSGYGGRGFGGMGAGADGGAGLERVFNNGESITLADIKVGDNVAGTGSLKDGVFVPVHLLDSPPRPHRQPNGGGASGAAGAGAGQPNAAGQAGPAGPGGR